MKLLLLILAIATAVIGFHIHHSFFWAITDFLFWPYVWAKWLIFHQVTLAIIKGTFAWFFQ